MKMSDLHKSGLTELSATEMNNVNGGMTFVAMWWGFWTWVDQNVIDIV